MTICIAAICDSGKNLIVASDSMITNEKGNQMKDADNQNPSPEFQRFRQLTRLCFESQNPKWTRN